MPLWESLHLAEQLAPYGLPTDAQVWRIELDDEDLRGFAGDRASDAFAVALVAVNERPWSPIDHPYGSKYPLRVEVGGSTPLDLVGMEVALKETPAILRWRWSARSRSRLDMLHVESLDSKQLQRLFSARRLAKVDWGPIGRPVGSTVLTSDEFEQRLRAAIGELRGGPQPFTLMDVAVALDMDQTTVRDYLRRAGTSWREVRNGNWPVG